jgi:hypothetical protein
LLCTFRSSALTGFALYFVNAIIEAHRFALVPKVPTKRDDEELKSKADGVIIGFGSTRLMSCLLCCLRCKPSYARTATQLWDEDDFEKDANALPEPECDRLRIEVFKFSAKKVSLNLVDPQTSRASLSTEDDSRPSQPRCACIHPLYADCVMRCDPCSLFLIEPSSLS